MNDILTANITASRNPVTVNVPSLSTSELTCHAEGLLNRKVNITDYFDQGKLCLRWDPENKEFTYNSYDNNGGIISNESGVKSVIGSELDVIDDVIVRSNKVNPSNPQGFSSNITWGVPNTLTNLKILNLECKVESIDEVDENKNILFSADYISKQLEISIKHIKHNLYIIKLNDYVRGWYYSAEYNYDPCEWHAYTICYRYDWGYLYLFIDGNLVLYCNKVAGRYSQFRIFLGNSSTIFGDPTYTNTVYYKNIVEYGFYDENKIMTSILKNYYKYDKYLINDWGKLDFSVFPPKLICTDGNILAPTVDEVGGYGGSVFVESRDNIFKVKELYCKDYRQTQSIFLSRSENNTGISIEYDFKVNNLSTLTSPNTKNSCALYTTSSMTYYYTMSLYLHLLDNGKYFISTNNNDTTPEGSYCYTEELDIDFSDWVHVEVFQVYVNYLSSVMYLRINGVLIPFTGPEANEDGSSKKGYTNWYYSFSAYTNWYGNEEVCLKNYKIKTLTENPDYEEYPELTYLWNTGETTKQITVQPTEPTTYSCTVTQGSRTASASILIDTILRINELPVAKINAGNIITIPKGPVAIIKANGGIYG